MIPDKLFHRLKVGSEMGKNSNLVLKEADCRVILQALRIVKDNSKIASDFPSDYVIALTPDKTTLFARKRQEGE